MRALRHIPLLTNWQKSDLMFSAWCDIAKTPVGNHQLYVLTARSSDLMVGVNELASIVPSHYSSEEKLAHLFKRLGKAKVASFLEEKLPTTKSIRSGDLGEILATEYINDETIYTTEINRLRWKDHRNMAMRGDDAIAMHVDDGEIQFLKVEVQEPCISFQNGSRPSKNCSGRPQRPPVPTRSSIHIRTTF